MNYYPLQLQVGKVDKRGHDDVMNTAQRITNAALGKMFLSTPERDVPSLKREEAAEAAWMYISLNFKFTQGSKVHF